MFDINYLTKDMAIVSIAKTSKFSKLIFVSLQSNCTISKLIIEKLMIVLSNSLMQERIFSFSFSTVSVVIICVGH